MQPPEDERDQRPRRARHRRGARRPDRRAPGRASADASAAATSRMIPDSAVSSPTASTRTRSEPPAATEPAMTLSPACLGHGLGLARDDRLIDVGTCRRPPCHRPGLGHRAARARGRPPSCASGTVCVAVAGDPLGRVGQQRGKGGQRAPGLGDRAHLQPVAQEHDRDQGRQLPPDLDIEEAQRPGPARHEGDADGERDEGHHPGLAVPQLADGSPEEDEAAVQEDDRAEDRPGRARSRERRGNV